MGAGLSPDEFWEMDEVETLLCIRGFQRRFEQWDDLLASVKATLIQPHLKKGNKAQPKKYRAISRDDSRRPGPEPPDEEERRERFESVKDMLGPQAIPVDLAEIRRRRRHPGGPVPVSEPEP